MANSKYHVTTDSSPISPLAITNNGFERNKVSSLFN